MPSLIYVISPTQIPDYIFNFWRLTRPLRDQYMVSEIQTEDKTFYHTASTQSSVIYTDEDKLRAPYTKKVYASLHNKLTTLHFSTALLSLPTVSAYLRMLTQTNTKYLSLSIPLSEKLHFYSATRACEVAETRSIKHCSGTGLRNYKPCFRGSTSSKFV